MTEHDAILSAVAKGLRTGERSVAGPFADYLQESNLPGAHLFRRYGEEGESGEPYKGPVDLRWTGLSPLSGRIWCIASGHGSRNIFHLTYGPEGEGKHVKLTIPVHSKTDARNLLSDTSPEIRAHFETHFIPHLPDVERLSRMSEPTSVNNPSSMTKTRKSESANSNVGSLHDIESQIADRPIRPTMQSAFQSDRPAPQVNIFNDDKHQIIGEAPAKKPAVPYTTEAGENGSLHQAEAIAHPKKLAAGFDLTPVHNNKISHPVVGRTDDFKPPHEKLVAGAQGMYGNDRDLNQPPPGPTVQSAFRPPHERPVKEGTKTPDDKRAWISEKIKKIMTEGLNGKMPDREQAIAAAYNMYKQEHDK